jgi:hypothetical protein
LFAIAFEERTLFVKRERFILTQKLGFYVNLEKCEIAAQLVKRYGEYLEDMPLEERLTFRAALCVYQILKTKVATLTSEDIPTNRELVVDAITLANSDAWMSEQLTHWIIGFASDEKMQFRLEPMIRALNDSISCDIG